jgi:lycopene cyclase domain-containing protein
MRTEYLLVLALVLLFPFVLSFTMGLGLFRHLRALVGSIVISTAVYGLWDIIVTARGHWRFNPEYILGFTLFGLPVEEWLFFVVIGFVSIFAYEAVERRLHPRP